MLGDALSTLHLVLLMIVALLVFGPRRLPELGGAVGKTIREFQKSMAEARAPSPSTMADPPDVTRPPADGPMASAGSDQPRASENAAPPS